jgi:hypothetical protein
MTTEERFAKLTPQHHHFAIVPDPWHLAVLGRFPWFRQAFMEGRVQPGTGDGLHSGPIENVWFSVDINGNLLQEWGFDPPPARL